MSAVASNRDGRQLIVTGSLLCFRHEHRWRRAAFPACAPSRVAVMHGRQHGLDAG